MELPMQLTENTALVTGGSSGIGLQLCKELLKRNNRVLTCGRSAEKLNKARNQLPGLAVFPCDLADHTDRLKLADWINNHHPSCNVLINNAALVHRTHFADDPEIIQKAEYEMQANFLAPLALCKLLLPTLERNANPAIVNITTGLVYAPKAAYPVYCATKAALHSFTQVLRMQLADRSIAIKEVLMSVVDTPWHNGNPPKIAISAEEAVDLMLEGLAKDQDEIRIGGVKKLYLLSRLLPSVALKVINRV